MRNWFLFHCCSERAN